MATRLKLGAERPGLPLGFTLVELIVVMAIIGIILVFLLIAANDALSLCRARCDPALITKLEGGVNDRLDALLQTRPDPNLAHLYMAGIYPAGYTTPMSQASTRAQVFAWYDYIKSELPDVFFVQNPDISDNSKNPYPLNFAANQFPGTSIGTDPYGLGNWMLPLGNSVANNPPPGGTDYGADNTSNLLGTGIFGASYYAAAGIYKNLGYLPAGYDGIDNNNNGAIDESLEGGTRWIPCQQHGAGQSQRPPASKRRGLRCSTPFSSRAWVRWARCSTATTSPTRKSRTPMATGCPSSWTPGAGRSSSSAGRSCTTPTPSGGR